MEASLPRFYSFLLSGEAGSISAVVLWPSFVLARSCRGNKVRRMPCVTQAAITSELTVVVLKTCTFQGAVYPADLSLEASEGPGWVLITTDA